jgi:hypothetical protein
MKCCLQIFLRSKNPKQFKRRIERLSDDSDCMKDCMRKK